MVCTDGVRWSTAEVSRCNLHSQSKYFKVKTINNNSKIVLHEVNVFFIVTLGSCFI